LVNTSKTRIGGQALKEIAMQPNIVAAPERAAEGRQRIDWVRCHMPILRQLEEEFREAQPLRGLRVVVSVHLEAKTAYLALVLRSAGAQVAVTGSNPESTKDEVVAALGAEGLHVYAHHGASPEEMREMMSMALDVAPNIIIDDGGDIVELLHEARAELLPHVLGACEETTSGVMRAKARSRANKLAFPVLLINDARCKYLFDNVHGTGQSVWDGVMRSTNLVVAGKTVVIAGYGWCGKGVGLRAQGLGAQVIVCEVDPVNAADALMNGCRVMPLIEACREADIVITATGVRHTLRLEHFAVLKDNVLLANAGHFWDEIDVESLQASALEICRMREQVEGFCMPDGRWLHLLGKGNLVNIACADGHPAEIMDTSFALQALAAKYLAVHGASMTPTASKVPEDIDQRVARLKLSGVGVSIDSLTPEQQAYRSSWQA
jgi:adenosylhomocysteinase